MRELRARLHSVVRGLQSDPAFSTLAVLILAAGIAATSVMYTLVDAVLLRQWPLRAPEQLAWMYNLRTERDRAPLSLPDLDDYRRDASSVTDLAAFTNWSANLTSTDSPERIEAVRVAGHFFPLLGTEPFIGRLLLPDDERRDARVAVLTYGLWERRFGADPGIVGRSILLNGSSYIVVGVLPPRFLFPFRSAELAVPLTLTSDPRRTDRGANFLRVVVRRLPSVTMEHAAAELNGIARRLQRLYPEDDGRKTGISLYPLQGEIVRDYRTMLWTLLASVGVLQLVGCVNLASLLLLRATRRRTEFIVRAALGASRSRIAWLVIGETMGVAIVAGVAAVVLTALGLSAWRMLGPADFPQMAGLAVTGRVIAFIIALALVSAIACAIAPAWYAARRTEGTLLQTARSMTANRGQVTVQRLLVATQAAAVTVLLVGMLVMTQGLERLERVVPGFAASQAVSMQVSLPPAPYSTRERVVRFADTLRDRIATIGGAECAGAVSLLPLSGLLSTADIALTDRPAPPPNEVPQAHLRVATPGYFNAAGIRVLEGRSFEEGDDQRGRPVAIVSRTFAHRFWPQGNAVGKALRIVQSAPWPELEIVGVVADVKQFTLDGPSTADLYVPLEQMPSFQIPLVASRMYWVVRGTGDILTMTKALRSAVSQVDAGVAASNIRTLEAVWQMGLGGRRANVRLLQSFGAVAVILCAIGVYAAAGFSVRSRRREMALRSALGATPRTLALAVVRQQLTPVVSGLSAGLAAALAAAPVLFSDEFEVSPRESVIYAEAAALLVVVAVTAILLPLRRGVVASPYAALLD